MEASLVRKLCWPTPISTYEFDLGESPTAQQLAPENGFSSGELPTKRTTDAKQLVWIKAAHEKRREILELKLTV